MPGKLTKEEFETMKEHTLIGASMLDKLEHYKDEKMIKIAYQICRWHHGRYDGKGYPDGLTGEQIPIAAQVVSVADVYDALVSKRVYKDAYSHEQAMKMILNGECGAFNPLLMEVLVEIQDKIKEEIRYEAEKRRNVRHEGNDRTYASEKGCIRWCDDAISGSLYGTRGNGRNRKYCRSCRSDRDRRTGGSRKLLYQYEKRCVQRNFL